MSLLPAIITDTDTDWKNTWPLRIASIIGRYNIHQAVAGKVYIYIYIKLAGVLGVFREVSNQDFKIIM